MKIVCIKMRYSIEPTGFLFFDENMGISLSNKYGRKLLDSAERPTIDAIKRASKRAIQKKAEPTGDLIRNKVAYKITSVSKKPSRNNNNGNNNNNNNSNNNNIISNNENNDDDDDDDDDAVVAAQQERYISREEKQQLINKLRLAPKKMSIFKDYRWINVNFKKDTYLLKKDHKLLIN